MPFKVFSHTDNETDDSGSQCGCEKSPSGSQHNRGNLHWLYLTVQP